MRATTIDIAGWAIPAFSANTIIVGAGAAGMNAAVHLVQCWADARVPDPAARLAVVTRGVGLGASRMSGSDKQTYYKMGTGPRTPDTAVEFARTLTAAGACHGDTALVEGLCSLREFHHLVAAGVPFPQDPWGAFPGYKTDNDPAERATSAGPRTSRFMSQCLQSQLAGHGVKIFDGFEAVEFICAGGRIVGLICLERSRLEGPRRGLTVFLAENWILAAGGPGTLYAATVYPPGQIGLHGPALRAGLAAANLSEWQYGLGSTKFRWNVSGTYMQAVPRIFSTDAGGGGEREFLTDYFDSMAEMAGNIFLKGYQWPFDAARIAGHQSSLIDMAAHQETAVSGRRVWMDFCRNPVGRPGWAEFRIDDLPPEARSYLKKAGAAQSLPIQRLGHMNPPAVEIYAENGIDLTGEPVEIALCAQHHNGGFAVNTWWESNVRHTFVIGEMAGTHGVKRPGGSALNAGQVGGLRAAEFIAHACSPDPPLARAHDEQVHRALRSVLDDIERWSTSSAAVTPGEALAEMRARMTRCGAHLRSRRTIGAALREATDQYRRIGREGLKLESPADLVQAVHAEQQCLTHAAVLFAINEMLARGAGSRGSHCVLDDAGQPMHPGLIDPATARCYRFAGENESLRDHILTVRFNADREELFEGADESPRPIPHRDVAFEAAWAAFRNGEIYEP